MKRKNGGASYAAQRKNLNDVAIEDEILPIVGDINNLLLYLNSCNVAMDSAHNKNVSEGHTHNVVDRTIKTVPISNEKETQRLIQRLVPYCQSLSGTALHIAHERTKLMAMIPLPIIKKIGSCRWLLIMAPSDKYENRTIEKLFRMQLLWMTPLRRRSIEHFR